VVPDVLKMTVRQYIGNHSPNDIAPHSRRPEFSTVVFPNQGLHNIVKGYVRNHGIMKNSNYPSKYHGNMQEAM
jgi:hypothetical protein